MTSKEALERIKRSHNVAMLCISDREDTETLNAIATIEKDLEILEVLKKHIYFSSKSGCIRMKDIYKSINNFDYEDLKEWLERC